MRLRLLGLDFETQGSDAATTNVTEVGAVLVESSGQDAPLQIFNQLVWEPGYPAQTQEIIELTGITDEQLQMRGKPLRETLLSLFGLIEQADYVLAHNVGFDREVLRASAARVGLTPPERPWVCTWQDVPYPAKYKCKKLSHLALDHGIQMDGRDLHRATEDVKLMLELVLTRYDFAEILRYKAIPDIIVRAVVPHPRQDNGAGKDLARASGFRWQEVDGKKFELCWVKKIKVDQLDALRKDFPYPVVTLEG